MNTLETMTPQELRQTIAILSEQVAQHHRLIEVKERQIGLCQALLLTWSDKSRVTP